MGTVKPSLAGPKRPQDRVLLSDMKANFGANVNALTAGRKTKNGRSARKFEDEGGATAVGQRSVHARLDAVKRNGE